MNRWIMLAERKLKVEPDVWHEQANTHMTGYVSHASPVLQRSPFKRCGRMERNATQIPHYLKP